MHKDDGILDHGAQRPNQPGQVGEEVLALGGVKEDTGAIRRIPEQTEHEEEQAEPLAGALALVFDDLRDARTEVADGACVAQDLRAQGDGLRVGCIGGLRHPNTTLPSESPPCGADGHDAEDAERVSDPGAGLLVDVEDGREGGGAAAARGLAITSV